MLNILDDLIARYPVLAECRDDIRESYEAMYESFAAGGKLLVAGNGGSAADSAHIVGELMKGFRKPRQLPEEVRQALINTDAERGRVIAQGLQQGLPAIALTEQNSLSTAFANDIGSDLIFAQQVNTYGKKEDVFLAISTSGNSENILNAAVAAKAKGIKTIALTGRDGGKLGKMADISIIVPETETYKIQELHLPVYHALCIMLEEKFF